MSSLAGPTFDRLVEYLTRMGAPGVALYKDGCFQRRLATRLRVRECSVDGYLAILDAEPAERDLLLHALAVGVTSFFRNPAAWARLGELVAAQPAQPGRFRAWSAGCAAGQEAYSIALLLARLESAGVASVQGFEVLGTDVDGDHLATARAGSYPGQAQAEIEVVVPNPRITVASDRIEIAPDLKDRVRFVREDLTDATRVDAIDLVLCRNVLIYFGDQGQESVLAALVRALRPGGLLMLGKAELAARSIPMIEPVDLRERIYRRVG